MPPSDVTHARMPPFPTAISSRDTITKGLAYKNQIEERQCKLCGAPYNRNTCRGGLVFNLRCGKIVHREREYNHSNPTARIQKVCVKYGLGIADIAIGNHRTKYRTELTEKIEDMIESGRRPLTKIQRIFQV